MRWAGHTPPVIGLRDGRACAIPLRAVSPAAKAWRAVSVILNGEPRGLANRANAKTKGLAAPSLKGTGRVETRGNQLTTQLEDRRISARAKTLGFAAVRANEHGADRSLRKLLLAIIRKDVPPKPVCF